MVMPVFRPPRPLGVTVLAILEILAGIFDILIGILLLFAYSIISAFFVVLSPVFDFLLIPLAILSLVFGILSFVLAYGLLAGKGWAWISTVILAIVSLIGSVLVVLLGSWFDIISIVFYLVILVYMFTAGVRAFFGRPVRAAFSGFPAPAQPYPPPAQYQRPQYRQPFSQQPQPAPQPYYPPPQTGFQQPSPYGMGACPNCGSPLQPYVSYCDRCGTRLR